MAVGISSIVGYFFGAERITSGLFQETEMVLADENIMKINVKVCSCAASARAGL